MRRFFYFSLALIVGWSFTVSAGLDRTVVRVKLEQVIELLAKSDSDVRSTLDLISVDREKGTGDLLVSRKGRDLLWEAGISFSMVKMERDLREERIDPQFYDYNDVTSQLASYQTMHPTIVQRHDLATTSEGRHVWAVKISDQVTQDQDEPTILFLGLHQAREIMSTEVCMDIVDYLATNYGSNPDVTDWVNTWEIWIVPMMNPDGSAYCWATDQYWIKNRRDLGGGVYGVDLGHNYPVDWDACFGSSSDPNSNSYHGPYAGSEPEVAAIMTLAEQQKFFAAISYNSFNELVLLPYGCFDDHMPEQELIQPFCNNFAALIQREDGGYGYSTGAWWELLYPTDGTEDAYFYANFGSVACSVEVNASSYYPSYSVRNTTVSRNRSGWQKLLDTFNSMPVVHGTITNACTGDPLEAILWYDEYPLTSKETPRRSEAATGRYACPARPGGLTLVVDAAGFIQRRIPLNFSSEALELNIEMIPTSEPGLVIWANLIDDPTGDQDYQLDPGEQAYLDICLLAPGLPVSSISGTLSTSDPYITILNNSASWPDIGSGEAAWALSRFRVQASAGTPEGHSAMFTVTFSTAETLCDNTDQTTVVVQTLNYLCPFWSETLDSDPGWSISAYPTSGSPPGPYNNWEFGVPISGPPGAYTGINVYGTGLSGNYDNNWTLTLTTPPIDCSELADAELQYARFINVESNYDDARIRIRNDGGSWITLFETDSSDANWVWHELDISGYADNQPNVEIRFDVRADSSISFPGYYVDDIFICGNYSGQIPPPPTPTIPPTPTQTPVPTSTPDIPFTYTPAPNTPTPSATFTAIPGSPTSTPLTPTHSPTPPPPTPTPTVMINTPTPTSTSSVTNTPVYTRTPTPTETPKYTETPTPSPTGTADTPTPTPEEMFAITLHLSDTLFEPGELFLLECEVQRHGTAVTVDRYIILDVYGSYFFHPTWTETLNFETNTYYNGYHETETIFSFDWPNVQGHASNLKFYAGCLYAGTATLVGDISIVEFGY